jgi:hypothetical protein
MTLFQWPWMECAAIFDWLVRLNHCISFIIIEYCGIERSGSIRSIHEFSSKDPTNGLSISDVTLYVCLYLVTVCEMWDCIFQATLFLKCPIELANPALMDTIVTCFWTICQSQISGYFRFSGKVSFTIRSTVFLTFVPSSGALFHYYPFFVE